MKQSIEIARKELRIIFNSPVGWILLLIFAIQLGYLLASGISYRALRVWSPYEDSTSLTYNLLFYRSGSLIQGMAGNLYIYIPLITMGLLSKEYSDGTIKLLFSSPLRTKDIVLGKYLAMMCYALAIVGLLCFFGILTGRFFIRNMDVQLFLWAAFIFYLMICAYMAIGLFISSLTSYQFVAALGVVGVVVLLNFAHKLSVDDTPAVIAAILDWLKGTAFVYLFEGFIGSWDILYFILMIMLFLGLTYLRLFFLRTSKPAWYKALWYIVLVAAVLSLGYISSHPAFKFYIDTRSAVTRDVSMRITRADLPFWNSILKGVIPLIISIIGAVLVIRRLRR